MVVYIRHADDNNKHTKHKHDPHITKRGMHNVKKTTKELISKYGCPDTIYVSPFRRCVDTVKIMVNEINNINNNNKINVICDVNLSRYFSKSDKKHPRVSKTTLDYNVPIYETKREFHKRINNHINETVKTEKSHNENIVWCITHALVYKNIAKKLHVSTNDRIDFLEYFSYNHHKHTNIDDGPIPIDQLLPEQLDPDNPEYVPMVKRFGVNKNIGNPL